MSDPVVEHLKQIAALLRLGFAEQIEAKKEKIEADNVSKIIIEQLANADGPLPTSDLLAALAVASIKVSDRTVGNRLSSLSSEGVVEKVGQGSATKYRLTGLI